MYGLRRSSLIMGVHLGCRVCRDRCGRNNLWRKSCICASGLLQLLRSFLQALHPNAFAVDMPQSTQPALSEQGEHAWKVGLGQDLGVGHSVLPRYAKDTADASQIEGIESFLLSGICGPRLAAVHQYADNTGIVHYHLDLHCQFGVGPHL